MARLVQLGGGGNARRSRAHDRHLFAGATARWFRLDPAAGPAVINDAALDVLDGDRRIIDAQHAGTFAGRGADAAGEFREVVGFVQPFQRLFPQPAIDQVVPLGNEVVNRTPTGHAADQLAGVAEGNPAVHTPRALLLQVGLGQVFVKFLPVGDASERRTVFGQFALVF